MVFGEQKMNCNEKNRLWKQTRDQREIVWSTDESDRVTVEMCKRFHKENRDYEDSKNSTDAYES